MSRLRSTRLIFSSQYLMPTLITAVLAGSVQAADVAKADNSADLNVASSWALGVLPTTSDVALWDATVTASSISASLGGNLSVLGLKVTNPGAAFTIGATASSTLTLAGSGLDMSAATQDFTINANTALGANQSWTINTGRTLTHGGVISGTGALTTAGAGTVTLAGANTYTGWTNISAGTVVVPTGGAINSPGTANVSGLTVGTTANINAILSITGGSVNALSGNGNEWSGYLNVGGLANAGSSSTGVANARGFVRMTSGTFVASRHLVLGNGSAAYGAFTISDGSLSQGSYFITGFNGGYGAFNQSGGATTLSTGFNGSSWLIGSGNGSAGIANISGGTLTATRAGITVAENGSCAGTLNISGSANVTVGNAGVKFANQASAVGILNLLGGTLTTNIVQRVAGTGIFNFNGGTLKPSAASTTFMTGLTGAYVHSGGGTIDNNGNAITIGQALLAPAGYGVNAIPVATPGAGYVDTPVVTISGGSGSGATAVATVSGGAVTGITLTNPGSGYGASDTLTVTLLGGGYTTAATLNAATLAANTSGGLTFAGSGTTTLSGVNTYTGTTQVNAGTLQAAAPLTGTTSVVVNGGTFTATSLPAVTMATISTGTLSVPSLPAATSLSVSSAGALTLTGSSFTVNGPMSVTGATLNVMNSVAQTITVTNGLTLSGTNAITMDVGTASDKIVVSGGASNISGTTAITVTPNGTFSIGTYDLITGTGLADTATPANFTVSPTTYGGGNLSLQLVGGTLQLVVSSSEPANLYWKGASSANWGTAGNWTTDAGGTSTASAAPASSITSVNFVATGASNLSTTVDTTMTVGGLNFTAEATSPVTIGGASNLLTISGISVASGSAAHVISNGGGVALGNNQTWNNDASNALTVSAPVSGASKSITKTGTGTIALNVANTYSGGTVINAGAIQIGDAAALGTGALTFGGGSLMSAADFTLTNTIAMTGAGDIAPSAGTLTLPGIISGSGGVLTKSGAGTVVLSGSNTFTGGVAISAGTLTMANATALGGGSNAVTLSGGSLVTSSTDGITAYSIANPVTLSTNSTIAPVSGDTLTLTGTITSASGVTMTKGDAGTLVVSGTGTYTGPTHIAGGTLQAGSTTALGTTSDVTVDNGATFALNNNSNAIASLTGGSTSTVSLGSGTLTISGASSTTFAGAATGTGGLLKNGTSTLTLSGTNTYTGATTVTGGTLLVTGTVTSSTSSQVTVGNAAGSAQLTVNGGTVSALKTAAPSLVAGSAAGAHGIIRILSGTLTNSSEIWLGANATGYGALTIDGGSVSVTSWLALARGLAASAGGGYGVLNLRGGALNLNSSPLSIGAYSGGTTAQSGIGVMTVTGGAFTIASNVVYVGENYPGILNMQGGTFAVSNTGQSLKLGNAVSGAGGTGGAGIVNLNGGTVTVPTVIRGSGTGTLNFNGGTLRANIAKTTFITGLSNVFIQSGGGTIDNGGFAITIPQVLATPPVTNFGVTGITLMANGTGYQDTPVVQITGGTLAGGGVAATAIANLDYTTGVISGITITNPGNYTDVTGLTVTFNGGGSAAIAPTVNTITTANLTSGGLTFTGSATTTLSAINTYTGTTTVSAGTVSLTGSLVSPIAVSGGTLSLVGSETGNVSMSAGTFTMAGGTMTGAVTMTGGSLTTPTSSMATQTITGSATVTDGTVDLRNGAINALAITGGLSLGGGTLAFDLNATTADSIAPAGGVSFTASPVAITLNDTGVVTGVTYTLLTSAAGLQAGDLSNFTFPALVNGLTVNAAIAGGALQVSFTSAAVDNAWWKGASGTSWNTLANWVDAASGGASLTVLPAINTAITFSASDVTTAPSSLTLSLGVDAFAKGITFSDATGFTISDATFGLSVGASGLTVTSGTYTLAPASLTLTAAQTWTLPNAFLVSAPMTGGGSLTKAGAGILTLSAANTFTGGTTISAGTIQVGNGGTTGSLPTSGAIVNNSTLSFNRTNAVVQGTDFSSSAISGTGSLVQAGSGTLTFNTANSFSGGVSVTTGTATTTASAGFGTGVVTVASDATAAVAGTGGSDITYANAFAGAGTLSITAPGTGSLGALMTGSLASFTGTIEINPGGTASGGKGVFSGTAPASAVTVNIRSGGTLYAADGKTRPFNLALYGGTTGESLGQLRLEGGSVMSGTLALNATTTIGSNSGTGTISGVVSGSNGFTKLGNGTIVLSGTNTYTGSTTVNAGTLQAGSSQAFGVNSAVTTANVANAILSLNGNSVSIGSLAGGGATGGNVTLGAGVLTVGGNGTSTSYAGIISGTGGVTKTGSGTQTLSATNTYTGTTTVNVGTLAVTSATGIASSAAVVMGGGTLTLAANGALSSSVAISGAGTITTTGGLTLNSTRSLAPTGALTLNSAVTLTGGGITLSPPDATASATARITTGALTVSNPTTITLSGAGSFNQSSGQTWKIIDATNTLTSTDLANFTLTNSTGIASSVGTWSLVLGNSAAISGGDTTQIWLVYSPVVAVTTVAGDQASGSALAAGSTLAVTLTFNQAVTWASGTPTLTLTHGSTALTAAYTSGQGTTSLVFTATMPATQTTTETLSVTGLSASPTITNIGALASMSSQTTATGWGATLPTWTLTDNVVPTIATITGNPVSGSTLTAGSTLTVTVTGSEALTWSGGTAPTLALLAGSTPVTAAYTSGQGSTSLVFTATVPTLASNTALSVVGFSATPTVTDTAGNALASQATATSWTGTPTLPTWTVQDGVVPTITTVVGNPVSGSTLTAGSTLTVTLTTSENVTWSGGTAPTLALLAGSTPVTAAYTSGQGTTSLVFTATVPTLASNAALSVVGFSATPTVTDAVGNALASQATATSWTGTPTLPTWTVQDGVVPTITTVVGNPVSGSTLTAGATLTVTLTTSENVTWSGGTAPTLALLAGSTSVTAAYTSGQGTTSLVFTATVPTLASNAALSVVGFSATPTVTDAVGNALVSQATATSWTGTPTLPTWTVQDGVVPTIATVVGNPVSGSTLTAGSTLTVTLTTSENVTWSGGTDPTLVMDVGGTPVTGTYSSGKGGTSLVFTATIPGIGSSTTLTMTGLSASPALTDAVGNALANQAIATSWTGSPTLPTWQVAASSDTTPPAVTALTGSPISGATLAAGSTLTITLTMSELVTWSGGTGPSLALDANGTTVTASYTSGKDTASLVFTVASLPVVATNAALTITGLSASPAVTDVSLNALVNQTAAASWTGTPVLPTWTLQDGVPPTITTVVGSPVSGSTLTAGSTLTVTVTGSEALTWSDGTAPTLALLAGSTPVTAAYSSGQGSTSLVFTVTVPALASNTALSVVGFSATPTVTDAATNALVNQATAASWSGSPTLPTWTVQDGMAPTITTVVGSPVSGSTLTASSTLTVTVTGSEALTWSGGTAPTLALLAGSTPVTAAYSSGQGTTSLVFTATVPTLASNTALSVVGFSATPTVTDAAANALANQTTATSWSSSPTLPTWTVQDGVAPTITAVVGSPASGSSLDLGSTLAITLTGSEAMSWSGGTNPTLRLMAGSFAVTATYTSGKGTTSLVFTAIAPRLMADTTLYVVGLSATPVVTDASGNPLASQETAASWSGSPTLPTWTVLLPPPTVLTTTMAPLEFTYDGANHEPSYRFWDGTTEIVGLVRNTDYTVTFTAQGSGNTGTTTVPPIAIGTYLVNVTVSSLTMEHYYVGGLPPQSMRIRTPIVTTDGSTDSLPDSGSGSGGGCGLGSNAALGSLLGLGLLARFRQRRRHDQE